MPHPADSSPAHLLIPFASFGEANATPALPPLPRLQALLGRLGLTHTDRAAPDALSPPHERALARALNLSGADGALPWAGWQLRAGGEAPGTDAWAWITPCHWQIGRDHRVLMHPPQALQLGAADSQALLDAMAPWFAEDGIALRYQEPTRWLARGELLRGLATASLDRVTGRDVQAWLPAGDAARTVRRLQSEMQMLLYTHPVNAAREAAGLLPVNSFWVSGCGALPQQAQDTPAPAPQVVQRLRDAALAQDGTAWAEAWRQTDATECAALLQRLQQGEAVQLTLCGESAALTFSPAAGGLWQRLVRRVSRHEPAAVLQQL